MKKVFITGIKGFVGEYLSKYLGSKGYDVYGCSITNFDNEKVFNIDIRDKSKLSEIIGKIKPEYIYHLAGQSSPSRSFSHPQETYDINVGGTQNLLDTILENNLINTRILLIGSSEIYGLQENNPIKEEAILNGKSPYSLSRIQQEELVKNEIYKPLKIIQTRSFNHTGIGQPPIFVIPEFILQVAKIYKGVQENKIYVGNLDAIRDFSDVRDIVYSYVYLLENYDKLKYKIYNIGSGKGYKLYELLEYMIGLSGKSIEIIVDKNRLRSIDVPIIIGNNSRLLSEGVVFKYTIYDTIKSMYENFVTSD